MQFSLTEAQSKYGVTKDGIWLDEAKHTTFVCVPPELVGSWINSVSGKPVTRIYCNADMSMHLLKSLENIVSRGLKDELETFDGCLMIRDVRGEPGKVSCHTYALAIDINAESNKLGDEPKMSPELVKCFTDEGFSWGGDFKRKDGMHFSFGWE